MKLSLAIAAFVAFHCAFAQTPAPHIDVLTNRYDIGRTGVNLWETFLNAKNISSSQFGEGLHGDLRRPAQEWKEQAQ